MTLTYDLEIQLGSRGCRGTYVCLMCIMCIWAKCLK